MGLISRVSSRTYRGCVMGKSKSSKDVSSSNADSGKSGSPLTVVQQLVAFNDAISSLYGAYMKETSTKLKLVDAYLFYILITGVIQFVYCCLVGTFPFNAFLSGFISLRRQFHPRSQPQNASQP